MTDHTAILRTVAGDVSPDSFDYFQCHEHVWIDRNMLGLSAPVTPIDDFDRSLAELKDFGSLAPGGLIVDCQPVSAGGDAYVLRQLSGLSGVGIIASTGFHRLCFYRQDSFVMSAGIMSAAEIFTRELHTGCGIIKVACENEGVTGRYLKLHSAAALAAAATGSKIICHIEKGADPLALIEFYGYYDIPPSSLILCHMDRAIDDISIHLKAAGLGAYLEYDTIARPKYHSDADEIALITRVCDAGFTNRILLGLDMTTSRLRSYSGQNAVGLCYIKGRFIAAMRESGIGDAEITAFTRENPRRALSFVPRRAMKQER